MNPSEPLSPAIEMLIPNTWDFQGAIHMYGAKTGCFSEAFPSFWEATSPDSMTKMQGIPNFAWQYSDDPQELHNLTDPNRRTHTGGKTNDLCAVAKPLSAEQYFRQMVLNDLTPAMTVVSIEPYPALEQLVRQRNGLPPADAGNGGARIDAIRVRLEFQKDNQPMELWYSLALVTQTYRAGRGFLYDIHAVGQVAFGAPKGKLDGNEKLFKVVMSSIQPTPRYAAYTNKWIANYYQIQANKEVKMDSVPRGPRSVHHPDVPANECQRPAGFGYRLPCQRAEPSRCAYLPRSLHGANHGAEQPVQPRVVEWRQSVHHER